MYIRTGYPSFRPALGTAILIRQGRRVMNCKNIIVLAGDGPPLREQAEDHSTSRAQSRPEAEITLLLQRWQAGDRDREGELWAILYSELAVLASRMLRRAGGLPSLEPEELSNETCLHLLRRPDLSWPSHGHFFAYASRVMHSILMDQGRRSRAAKRRVEIDGAPPETFADPRADRAFKALDIDQALTRLARISPRASSLIELRFWEGLPVGEAATALHISKATAVREWQAARSWLHDQLRGGTSAGAALPAP
jgi:RNA polymerase sigma factor (TIGR02999 family)